MSFLATLFSQSRFERKPRATSLRRNVMSQVREIVSSRAVGGRPQSTRKTQYASGLSVSERLEPRLALDAVAFEGTDTVAIIVSEGDPLFITEVETDPTTIRYGTNGNFLGDSNNAGRIDDSDRFNRIIVTEGRTITEDVILPDYYPAQSDTFTTRFQPIGAPYIFDRAEGSFSPAAAETRGTVSIRQSDGSISQWNFTNWNGETGTARRYNNQAMRFTSGIAYGGLEPINEANATTVVPYQRERPDQNYPVAIRAIQLSENFSTFSRASVNGFEVVWRYTPTSDAEPRLNLNQYVTDTNATRFFETVSPSANVDNALDSQFLLKKAAGFGVVPGALEGEIFLPGRDLAIPFTTSSTNNSLLFRNLTDRSDDIPNWQLGTYNVPAAGPDPVIGPATITGTYDRALGIVTLSAEVEYLNTGLPSVRRAAPLGDVQLRNVRYATTDQNNDAATKSKVTFFGSQNIDQRISVGMLTPGASVHIDTALQPQTLDIQATNIDFDAVVQARGGTIQIPDPQDENKTITQAFGGRIDLGYTTQAAAANLPDLSERMGVTLAGQRQARQTPRTDVNNSLVSVIPTVGFEGSGYVVPPRVIIESPTTVQAVADTPLVVGGVGAVSIDLAGNGYTETKYDLTFSTPTQGLDLDDDGLIDLFPRPAKGYVTVNETTKKLRDVVITDPGFGYVTTPTVSVPPADEINTKANPPRPAASNVDGVVTVSLGGFLTGVSIDNQGFSYQQQNELGELQGLSLGETPERTSLVLTALDKNGAVLRGNDNEAIQATLLPIVGSQSYVTEVLLPPELIVKEQRTVSITEGADRISGIDTDGLEEGMLVTGTGIRIATSIESIDSALNEIVLTTPNTESAPITKTRSAAILEFGQKEINGVDNYRSKSFIDATLDGLYSFSGDVIEGGVNILNFSFDTSLLSVGMLVTGDGIGFGTTISDLLDSDGDGEIDLIQVDTPFEQTVTGANLDFGGTYSSWVDGQIRYEFSEPNRPLGVTKTAEVVANLNSTTGRIESYTVIEPGEGYGRPPSIFVEPSRPQEAAGELEAIIDDNGSLDRLLPLEVDLVTNIRPEQDGKQLWDTGTTNQQIQDTIYEEQTELNLVVFRSTVTRNGVTTTGSAIINNVSDTSVLFEGMPVAGPGIADNTTVASVEVNSVTLSKPATSTNGSDDSPSTYRFTVHNFPRKGTVDTTANGTTISGINASGLVVGARVTGPNCPDGTVVAAINLGAGGDDDEIVVTQPENYEGIEGSIEGEFKFESNLSTKRIELEGTISTSALNTITLQNNGGVELEVGMAVLGVGILPGTVIESVDLQNGNTITLSKAQQDLGSDPIDFVFMGVQEEDVQLGTTLRETLRGFDTDFATISDQELDPLQPPGSSEIYGLQLKNSIPGQDVLFDGDTEIFQGVSLARGEKTFVLSVSADSDFEPKVGMLVTGIQLYAGTTVTNVSDVEIVGGQKQYTLTLSQAIAAPNDDAVVSVGDSDSLKEHFGESLTAYLVRTITTTEVAPDGKRSESTVVHELVEFGESYASAGYGYTGLPNVTVSNPLVGRPAEVTPELDPSGRVVNFEIADRGTGLENALVRASIDAAAPSPVLENLSFNAAVGAEIYDIRIGDDPSTEQETGRLFVGPTASLGADAVNTFNQAASLHIEAVTTNIFVEGATFAKNTSILMQSEISDASKGPFTLTTNSETTGEAVGTLSGEEASIILGNEAAAYDGANSLAQNYADLTVDFVSLRIRAGDGDLGVYPYEMTVRDINDLALDAVAASSDAISFSADGGLFVNASIDTVSDVTLSAGTGIALNAPVTSESGQIRVSSTGIDVSAPLTVTDRRADARRPNDIIVEATSGDLAVSANINAKNGVRLSQRDAVQGSSDAFKAVTGKGTGDGNTGGGLSIGSGVLSLPIQVPQQFTYDQIEIEIDVNIQRPYGLNATLVTPLGNRYLLVSNEGYFGTSDFIDTVFASNAQTSIRNQRAPFTGTFAAESSLNGILINQPSAGEWRLEFSDYYSYLQNAQVVGAEIRFVNTEPLPGNVSGVGLVRAGSVSIDSDGDIGDSTLPVGASGYFLNVDVNNVEVTSKGSVSINALDRLTTTSLSAGVGEMVTLSALGRDGELRNDGTRAAAINATVQDVDFLQVTAPNGSIDVLIQSSDDVTIGNPGAIGLGTALPMLAAGDVNIRTTGGSLANNVSVFDAPSAGSSAIEFDTTLLGEDLTNSTSWRYETGDEGVRASFILGDGNQPLPASLGLQLGDRVLFLGNDDIVPTQLGDRGGLEFSNENKLLFQDPSQFISEVNVTNGGTGYTDGNLEVTFIGSGGRNATAQATVSGGSVQAVTVTGGGEGYTADTQVAFGDAGQGAEANVVLQYLNEPISLLDSDQKPLKHSSDNIDENSRPNWTPVALYDSNGDKFLVWRFDSEFETEYFEREGSTAVGSALITQIHLQGLSEGLLVEGAGIEPDTTILEIDEENSTVTLSSPVSVGSSDATFSFGYASKQFAVWGMRESDSGFIWDGSEELLSPRSAKVFELETTHQIELDGDGKKGLYLIEEEGNTNFGYDRGGNLYAGGTKVSIDGRNLSKDFYRNWEPIAAETTGVGNFLVWQYSGGNAINVWVMDSQWEYQRTDIAPRPGSAEFFAFEESIGTDLNNDNEIGQGGGEAVGSIGIRADRSGILRVGVNAVTRNSVEIREDTYPNWTAKAISVGGVNEDGESVNKLLWVHDSNQRLSIWELNEQWEHQSYGEVPSGGPGTQAWADFVEEFGNPQGVDSPTSPPQRQQEPGGGKEVANNFLSAANGLYEVLDLGGTGAPWKLVRMPERNTSTEFAPGSFLKNVTSGDTYVIDYERGAPEDRLFGKNLLGVERRNFNTVIETQDINDTVQYIVSSGTGTNTDAGTLGKMITLLEDNNPRDNQLYEIAFQEAVSTVSLQQELPGITKSLTIDGARRFIATDSSIRDVTWSLDENGELVASYDDDAGSPQATEAQQIFVNASSMFIKRNGEAIPQSEIAGAEFDGLLFIGPNRGSEVRNLAFGNFKNGAAVTLDGSEDVSVLGNQFGQNWQGDRSPNDIGILVYDSKSSLIEENAIGPNGVGIQLEESSDAVIVGNRVGLSSGENDIGIKIINSDSSDGNKVGIAPVEPIRVSFLRGDDEIDVTSAGSDWIATAYSGLSVYGTGVPPDTFIKEIVDDGTNVKIKLSKPVTQSTSVGRLTRLEFGTRSGLTSAVRNVIFGNRVGLDISGGSQTIVGNEIVNNRDHGIQINTQGTNDEGTGKHRIGELSQVPLGASRVTGSSIVSVDDGDVTEFILTDVAGINDGDFIHFEGGNTNLTLDGTSENAKVVSVNADDKTIQINGEATIDEGVGLRFYKNREVALGFNVTYEIHLTSVNDIVAGMIVEGDGQSFKPADDTNPAAVVRVVSVNSDTKTIEVDRDVFVENGANIRFYSEFYEDRRGNQLNKIFGNQDWGLVSVAENKATAEALADKVEVSGNEFVGGLINELFNARGNIGIQFSQDGQLSSERFLGSDHEYDPNQGVEQGIDKSFNRHFFALPDPNRPDAPSINPLTGSDISGQPEISGLGVAFASVELYLVDGEVLIGTGTVGADGTWKVIPFIALQNGSHTISARQIVSEMTSDFSPQVTFIVTDGSDPTDPPVPPVDPPVDPPDPGPGDPIEPPVPEEPIWPGLPF